MCWVGNGHTLTIDIHTISSIVSVLDMNVANSKGSLELKEKELLSIIHFLTKQELET